MRRRGESWELRVYLGRDPISGKPQYRSRSFRGTKRLAEEQLSRLCTQALDSTSDPTVSRQTFGELVEQWFASWSPEWSPATASITRGIIDTKLSGLVRVRLDRITPASLDTFYAALRERGGGGGTPLAQATVRRIHAVVSSALEQGVRWGWLQTNPAQRAWKGKGKGRNQSAEVSVPSPADVVALLDAAWASGEWNLAALLELEVHTGLRRAELLALHWADFDAERRTLRVAAAMVGGPAGLVEKAATKTGNHRTVVLSPEAVAVLVAQRERCVDRAGGEPSTLAAAAYVFSTVADGSRPWWPSSVSRSLRLLGERAGLAPIRLQELRRFHSSVLITGGVDVATESERLGHGAAVALRSYARSNRAAHERAADLVAATLADQRRRTTRDAPTE
ncbi:MAG: tyrosine-type recombinase/integrase [Acidimicrobiales bacterium]